MNDQLLEAREELKRLEHIIYVSLKYTRTVDVLEGAVKRLVSIFDWIIEGLLTHAVEENKLDKIPKSPALRATKVAELYAEDERMQKYLRFYMQLRVVLSNPHEKRREFRRHVTLITPLDAMTVEVDCDNLINCENYTHSFLRYAWELIDEEAPDDRFFK